MVLLEGKAGGQLVVVLSGLMMAVGFVVLLSKLAVPQPMLLSCGEFSEGLRLAHSRGVKFIN